MYVRPFMFVIATCLPLAAFADASHKGGAVDVQVAAPGTATCIATDSAQHKQATKATNAARARAGLPPLRANTLLARVAAQHACDMAQRGRMTHAGTRTTGPGARVKKQGYAPLVTAENIAAGPFDLQRVLVEWENSPGHRQNMLIPAVRDYGIGHAVSPDGRTRFWAAVYAAPRR